MNAWVIDLLSNSPAQRIAWALIHFLWQGAALALLLAAILQLLRNRSAQLRWALCCGTLGLMVVLPVMTACMVSVDAQAPVAGPAASPPATAEPVTPSGPASGTVTVLPPDAAPRLNPVAANEEPPSPPSASGAEVPGGIAEVDSAAPRGRQISEFLHPALPWCLAVWVVGVVAMSVWHVGGGLLLERTKRHGVRLADPAIRDVFDRLLRRLKVSRPARLLESVSVAVPTVAGWLRPVVLLPASALSGLSIEQLEAVLAHELAHIRRYDCLVRLIQVIVETLLFYHPAVWWVSRRIRQESEDCCDDVAVTVCGSRVTYARALATMEELGAVPAAAVAVSGGRLLDRIRRIVGLRRDRAGSDIRRWGAAAAAVFVLAGLTVAAAIFYGCATEGGAAEGHEDIARPATRPAERGETHLRTWQRDGASGSYVVRILPDGTEVKHGLETIRGARAGPFTCEWKDGRPWTGTLVFNLDMRDMEFEYFKEGKRVTLAQEPFNGVHYVWVGGRRRPKLFRDGMAVAPKKACPALIQLLKDKGKPGRNDAALALGQLAPATGEVVSALTEALKDEDVSVREAVAKALATITPAPKEAVAALIQALKDERDSKNVWKWAVSALGRIGPGAVGQLLEALQDKDARHAWNLMVWALGETGPRAVPQLIRALKHKDRFVRSGAASALSRIGPASKPAIPALIGVLKDQGTDVRRWAASALTVIGPDARQAVADLIPLLKDNDSDVRISAAWALAKIGPAAKVMPALLGALKHEDWRLRWHTALVLGQMVPPARGALPGLLEAMKDKHAGVRTHAAESLGRVAPAAKAVLRASVVRVLGEALNDKDASVRQAAVLALGKMGTAAVPRLIGALKHQDPIVRTRAAEALKRIRAAKATTRPATQPACRVIVTVRKSPKIRFDAVLWRDERKEGKLAEFGKLDVKIRLAGGMPSWYCDAKLDARFSVTPRQEYLVMLELVDKKGKVVASDDVELTPTGISTKPLLPIAETLKFKLIPRHPQANHADFWGYRLTAVATRIAPPATQAVDPGVTVEQTKGKCGYAGRVIDAETGKPVEKFAIRTGWTKEPAADAKDIPWYTTTWGHQGGKFRISHSLPDDRKQFVYFRILADGYLPQLVSDKPLSRPLRYKGVVVRLRRGRAITGRVLDHKGKSVTGANVFLVSRQRRLELVDGKPERFTGSSGKTDKDGRFKLPGAGEMTTHVVVSCKSLHAWLTRIPKVDGEMSIKLPAPATVILKYDIPGAAANRFRLALATWDMPQWKGIFNTTGDIVHKPQVAQGTAVTLRNLTPGVYDVSRSVTTRVSGLGRGIFCDRTWIELKSGETTRINFVRKTGVPIVGDIPGLAANGCDGAFISIEETTVRPGPHSSLGPTIVDSVACGPDGKFRTSRIRPGRYNVTIEAHVSKDPSGLLYTGERAPAFFGSAVVTVPASGEPVRVRILMKHLVERTRTLATAAALERCWGDLATEDYVNGSRAAADLVAADLAHGGDEAVKFLSGKLLILTADPAKIKQLIVQLDSPQFKVRVKAQDDLKALGMAALPGLRGAGSNLSIEVRTAIKVLLTREPVLLMRMERAIDVLARLNRGQCLQVVGKLAKRDPNAPEIKLAKAKLQAFLTKPVKAAPATPAAGPGVTVEKTKGKCGYVGRVIDAKTGKPVETFAIQYGRTPKPAPDPTDISWRWGGQVQRKGEEPVGEFRVDESLSEKRKEYVYFRILAHGYLPQMISETPISGPLTYKGVVVRLKPGRSITGRVLDHTGKPVANAKVFLISEKRRLSLVDGEPEYDRLTPTLGKTDHDGRFTLRGSGQTTTRVLVSHESLHAWLTRVPKAGVKLTIRLPQPATIIVRYDIPGAAKTGDICLHLKLREMPEWLRKVDYAAHTLHAPQKGKVVLRNLTPGPYEIFRSTDAGGHVKGVNHLLDTRCGRRRVELKSGQTVNVDFIRKTGVAIVGSVSGLAANGCGRAFIRVEESGPRAGFKGDWEPTLLDHISTGPDGKFKTSRIPPGRYTVVADAYAPDPSTLGRSGFHQPTFVGSTRVTVPETGQPVRVRILMKHPVEKPKAPATAAALERCWGELATEDYVKGSRAAAALDVGGDKAAKFLSSRLIVSPADPARIKQLVAQLDSSQFEVRVRAQADLKALDIAALPGLRAAAGGLSIEVRTAIKVLLAREPVLLMRMERAIDALAKLNRPQCLQVVGKLAKGDPNAPETKLAKAKLQTLLTKRAKPADAAAAMRPRGSRLEFRIVPNGIGSSRGPIIPSYVGRMAEPFAPRARRDLAVNGPGKVAYGSSGLKLRWIEMKHEIPRGGLVVPLVGKYKGKDYVLLCDGDPYVMLPAARGKGAWGLAEVHAAKDAQGRPGVMVKFDKSGGKLFERLTKANRGNALAVIVDGKVLSSPVIRTAMSTHAIIVGDFTDQQVRSLVGAFKAGMPPNKLPATQPAAKGAGKAAFQTLTLAMTSTWQWNRTITIHGDGTYVFDLQPLKKVPGKAHMQPDDKHYIARYRIQAAHLRQLEDLLKATKWLTTPGKVERGLRDGQKYALAIVRGPRKTSTVCYGDQGQAYKDLVRFLRRIDRQEWLLYQMTPNAQYRSNPISQLDGELDAVLGKRGKIAPYAPVLDYKRLLPALRSLPAEIKLHEGQDKRIIEKIRKLVDRGARKKPATQPARDIKWNKDSAFFFFGPEKDDLPAGLLVSPFDYGWITPLDLYKLARSQRLNPTGFAALVGRLPGTFRATDRFEAVRYYQRGGRLVLTYRRGKPGPARGTAPRPVYVWARLPKNLKPGKYTAEIIGADPKLKEKLPRLVCSFKVPDGPPTTQPTTQPATRPSFDAGAIAKSRAVAIEAVLPKGWSVKIDRDTVIIRRDEKVRGIHNSPVAPAPNKIEWFPAIMVRLGPRVSMVQYSRMALANEAARKLRPNYSPYNRPNLLPHSLPTHRDGQASFWISGVYLDRRIEFESKDVAQECTGVYGAIKGLFGPYTSPYRLWGTIVNGLHVGLDVERPAAAPDGKIRLLFRMRNVGDKPVRVLRLSAQARSWGEHLPIEVKVGRARMKYRGPVLEPPPPPGPEQYVQLKPGEIDSIEVMMNPAHWGVKDLSKAAAAFVFTNARGKVAPGSGASVITGLWTGTVRSTRIPLAVESTTQPGPTTQPATMALGRDRLKIEVNPPDNLPGGLYAVGPFDRAWGQAPDAHVLYQWRIEKKIGDGYEQLVGRVPVNLYGLGLKRGAALEVLGFTRVGNRIRGVLKYTIPPKGAKLAANSVYLRAFLPALPPGRYVVEIAFEDHYR